MTERNIFREKARVAVRRNKANMKANAMTDRAAIIETSELALYWKTRAQALRMISHENEEIAETFEECAGELTAALSAVPPAPPSSDDTELQNMGLVFDKVGNPAPPSSDTALVEKYKAIVQFYDEHVGTPCEQIRHAEEIANLQDENAQLAAVNRALTSAPPSIPEREKVLADALRGMLAEWDKLTRYGSPLAKAANENVNRAKAAIAALEGK